MAKPTRALELHYPIIQFFNKRNYFMRFRSVYRLFKLIKRKAQAYEGNHEEVKRWGVSACSIFKVEPLNHQQQTMTGVRSRMKISKLVTVFLPS